MIGDLACCRKRLVRDFRGFPIIDIGKFLCSLGIALCSYLLLPPIPTKASCTESSLFFLP